MERGLTILWNFLYPAILSGLVPSSFIKLDTSNPIPRALRKFLKTLLSIHFDVFIFLNKNCNVINAGMVHKMNVFLSHGPMESSAKRLICRKDRQARFEETRN